jgi:hypothetical protein
LLIELFAPVIKPSTDYLSARDGSPANARHLYESSGNLGGRLLVPCGAGLFDVFTLVHVPTISGRETEAELRRIASMVETPLEAKRAPHITRNHTYIFLVDHFTAKFVRSRSRIMGADLHYRYWFFSDAMPPDQVQARVRLLAGRIYLARAKAIRARTLERKHTLHGDLQHLVRLWTRIGRSLVALGEKTMTRWRVHPEGEKSGGAGASKVTQKEKAAGLLQAAAQHLPRLYEDLRALVSIYYPELTGAGPGPGPPGKSEGLS